MTPPLDVARDAAAAAGDIILRSLTRTRIALAESHHDIKLATDRECQDEIVRIVRSAFPNDGIVAEEDLVLHPDAPRRWVIDPLDGTVNFARGIPQFCTSIALEENGRAVAGVVYDPLKDELFEAERGAGARLNGEPIRVSKCTSLREAILACGFFKSEETIRRTLAVFSDLVFAARKIRIMGAAALDGCYTACGRFDGYLEHGIKRWDVAAAILIIEEAGGLCRISGQQGEHEFDIVCASTTPLLDELSRRIAAAPVAASPCPPP